MPSPGHRCAAVRAYCDQLRHLMAHLATDPLSESRSVALITHIVTSRGPAAAALEAAETQRAAATC